MVDIIYQDIAGKSAVCLFNIAEKRIFGDSYIRELSYSSCKTLGYLTSRAVLVVENSVT